MSSQTDHSPPAASRRESALARVPVAANDWFLRQGWSLPERTPSETLRGVRAPERVIEDFCPLGSHLECRLSEHFWATRGVLAFAENRVPYVINNSGFLSQCVAEVVFAACEADPPPSRWYVAELGCGSALFAKLFLDDFQLRCRASGREYYESLIYLATDRSPVAVAQWRERQIFAEHSGHVEPIVLDASAGLPAHVTPRAVICNYLLDVLPTAVLRRTATGEIEQLCVRTHFAADSEHARVHGEPSLDELRALVAHDTPQARDTLLQYLSRFELEVEFRPASSPTAAMREACADAACGERVLYNHAAFECTTALLGRLEPHGFIVINDYGPSERSENSDHAPCQRFDATTAFGVNFPLLERKLAEFGGLSQRPSGDAGSTLHSRLVSVRPLLEIGRAFEQHFGGSGRGRFERELAAAREHAAAGRIDPALSAYRTCLDRNPGDWQLIGEVIELMVGQIRNYHAALALAQSAVQLNPMYSTWLWNLLGETLQALARHDEAHEAYLQAERVDPLDPRTALNLGSSYLCRGQHEPALSVIARGLAADGQGNYRDRLLAKQSEVLAAVSSRALEERRRRQRRHERLQELSPTPSAGD